MVVYRGDLDFVFRHRPETLMEAPDVLKERTHLPQERPRTCGDGFLWVKLTACCWCGAARVYRMPVSRRAAEMPRARAILTMLSRLTFRSPRSIPPIYVQ